VTQRGAWVERLVERFCELFGGREKPFLAVAPGRVNLIGEHTDYNDGWVLPMAIDRRVGVAARGRDDLVLRAHSVVFNDTRELRLADLGSPGGSEWIDYVAGTAWAVAGAGYPVSGADIVVDGDVPLGSGLASSAAIEMATARALCAVAGIGWSPVEMALIGQRVEGEYIGVKGGVMDQFTAVMGERGHALLLDCRTLKPTLVPMPDGAVVVVMDTGAPRSLAASAYNDRSRSCREAVAALQAVDPSIRALRDVDLGLLESEKSHLDPTVYRRARHVVTEIDRPRAMAEALRRADFADAGRLMNESHASLRDFYEVSSVELDYFTGLARAHPACFGARLTGAGFGGCAIALVSAAGAEGFIEDVHAGYRAHFELPSAVFACHAEAGARMA
jgi:galactokinase